MKNNFDSVICSDYREGLLLSSIKEALLNDMVMVFSSRVDMLRAIDVCDENGIELPSMTTAEQVSFAKELLDDSSKFMAVMGGISIFDKSKGVSTLKDFSSISILTKNVKDSTSSRYEKDSYKMFMSLMTGSLFMFLFGWETSLVLCLSFLLYRLIVKNFFH